MASTCMSIKSLGSSRAVAPSRSRAASRNAVIVRADQRTRVEEPKSVLKDAKKALDNAQHEFVPDRTPVPDLPENWTQAVPNGGESPTTKTAEYGAGDAMSFSGPAPEIINCRLAMLGFAAAVGSEIITGKSVSTQFFQAPAPTIAVVVLIAIASLIPMIRGADLKWENGPWTKKAELWNGRIAMMGFAGLVLTEFFKGGAVF